MPTLDWLNKAQALKAATQVPYRLLEPQSVHGDPAADNWLIQGDNLDALKALLPFFAGRVKCIYIDPPYNTRSAFEHYDDIAGFATDARGAQCLVGARSRGIESRSEATVIGRIWSRDLLISLQDISLH